MCDNKKGPKILFVISGDPRHAPGDNFLHHCILLFITLDLICNMTMFVQNGFWTLRGDAPVPAPRHYIKLPKVFPHSSSIGLSPVKASRFQLKWSRSNGVTLQTDVLTAAGRTLGCVCVWGGGGVITISSLFLRDNNEISLCWKISAVLNLLIACKEVNNKIYIKYCRKSFEPDYDQTNNKTCKISEELDQPEQPRNLIRVFADRVCLLG